MTIQTGPDPIQAESPLYKMGLLLMLEPTREIAFKIVHDNNCGLEPFLEKGGLQKHDDLMGGGVEELPPDNYVRQLHASTYTHSPECKII